MAQSLDRLVFLGSVAAMTGAALALKETGAIAAAAPTDAVLDAVVAETIALGKRVLSNPIPAATVNRRWNSPACSGSSTP